MRYALFDHNESDILKILHNRLDCVYNRSIGCSPYELHFKENPLDISHKLPKNLTEIANRISKKRSIYDINAYNKKPKHRDIKIDDQVFVETPRHRKQEILFDGPFRVIDRNTGNSGIKTINHNRKSWWINVRTCFQKRGQNVGI